MGKIIYIDDDKINIELFEINFKKKYDVFVALNPIEGLEIIKNEDIKVIVTDYKMPIMNGMELINHVKKIQPNSICMILSGYLESEVVTDKTKVFKYIMKPYKREEMMQNIEDAFKLLKSLD
jgi:DNA-binding NtrC family response regulator